VKPFRWNPDKNGELLDERGVSFERVVVAIEGGGLLDVLVHPNSKKYPNQRLLVVAWDGYADLVPYVEEAEYYFLKTVIPSRRPRETTASLENQMSRPDPNETEFIEAYELGKLKSVASKAELSRLWAAARATAIKDRRVNIRLSAGDLQDIQVKALQEGMPYQTLIASILHKYVTGRLEECKPMVPPKFQEANRLAGGRRATMPDKAVNRTADSGFAPSRPPVALGVGR
jgi:predicted DNA binding CopG/RHH family protein